MSWVARAPGIGPARCESNCRDARLSKESRPQNPSDHQQTISHEDLPCARLARRVPNPVTGRLRLRRSRVASPSHRAGGGPGGARQREEDRAGDADGSDGEGLPKAEEAGWGPGPERHLARAALGDGGRSEGGNRAHRSEEHTSELQSLRHLVCRLLLEK